MGLSLVRLVIKRMFFRNPYDGRDYSKGNDERGKKTKEKIQYQGSERLKDLSMFIQRAVKFDNESNWLYQKVIGIGMQK
jgi:hypothetical protein